jgi:hypothetical protein
MPWPVPSKLSSGRSPKFSAIKRIARVTASKPVRLAVEAGLFPPDTTYFDYGCGHGADIEYIQRMGLTSLVGIPYFRPMCPPAPPMW